MQKTKMNRANTEHAQNTKRRVGGFKSEKKRKRRTRAVAIDERLIVENAPPLGEAEAKSRRRAEGLDAREPAEAGWRRLQRTQGTWHERSLHSISVRKGVTQ